MKFNKYQHLERLGTSSVKGIEQGLCYVFPKLDGTNASVWLGDDGKVKAGSRNRELTLEKDNAGFCAWVQEHPFFEEFFFKYPHLTLYGEWLVPHSLKTYRDDAWCRFYVFDVVHWDGEEVAYWEYDRYQEILEKFGFDYLAPLAKIRNGTNEQFRECCDRNTYLIKEGKGVGEGVVVKNYDFVNQWGSTVWAKVITNSFKEEHVKAMGSPEIGGKALEEKIVDKYITQHLVDKTYAKIENDGGFTGKSIPRLLNTVYHDLITEELWNILKEFKNPTIEFGFLQRLTISKIKELKPEVF